MSGKVKIVDLSEAERTWLMKVWTDEDRLNTHPTSARINALPENVRSYIHDLETRSDPAGNIRRGKLAEDENRALRASIAQLTAELAEAQERERAAQTEAAAMRGAIESIHAGMGERNWIYEACERALSRTAGRALAERVTLLEAVAKTAEECKGTGGTNPEDGPFSRLRKALAALDAKGTSDV